MWSLTQKTSYGFAKITVQCRNFGNFFGHLRETYREAAGRVPDRRFQDGLASVVISRCKVLSPVKIPVVCRA